MIFAGDRSKEFRARMLGESYTAGGIAHTVEKTRAASDELLRSNARSLLNEAYISGTTTIEIKSGYGLTVKDERRSLEIAQGLSDETTFLGAHVVLALPLAPLTDSPRDVGRKIEQRNVSLVQDLPDRKCL